MLDTLTAADQLTAAGIESQQAKAIVAVIRDSETSAITKPELDASLRQLEGRINDRISILVTKSELDSRLRQLEAKIESRISRSGLVQTIATVILVVALLKFL